MSQPPPQQQQQQQQGQQVSIEDAFPVYRQKTSELFDETLILRAKVAMLEKQLAAVQNDNERLKAAAAEPLPGPDLAAKPSYDDGYDGKS